MHTIVTIGYNGAHQIRPPKVPIVTNGNFTAYMCDAALFSNYFGQTCYLWLDEVAEDRASCIVLCCTEPVSLMTKHLMSSALIVFEMLF